jgi:hypothetical protein
MVQYLSCYNAVALHTGFLIELRRCLSLGRRGLGRCGKERDERVHWWYCEDWEVRMSSLEARRITDGRRPWNRSCFIALDGCCQYATTIRRSRTDILFSDHGQHSHNCVCRQPLAHAIRPSLQGTMPYRAFRVDLFVFRWVAGSSNCLGRRFTTRLGPSAETIPVIKHRFSIVRSFY